MKKTILYLIGKNKNFQLQYNNIILFIIYYLFINKHIKF